MCAMMRSKPACLINVDFPPMLGPVTRITLATPSCPITVSFGTYEVMESPERQGCRPSRIRTNGCHNTKTSSVFPIYPRHKFLWSCLPTCGSGETGVTFGIHTTPSCFCAYTANDINTSTAAIQCTAAFHSANLENKVSSNISNEHNLTIVSP